MNPLKIIKFAAPGLDEAMELYPTYLNWKDKTADRPNQTRTERHFADKEFYGKILTTYAPIAVTMVATTVFLSQQGQDFFTNGMSAIDLATHFTQNMNDFKSSGASGLLGNALALGGEFVDFSKAAATEIMANTNNYALAMGATIYAGAKTITGLIKSPLEFLTKADRKNESLWLEKDVMSLLKEKSDAPFVEKYNDFNLFAYAHRFNDALFEIKDKHPTFRNKMKHNIIKWGSDLMESAMGHETKELKQMIQTNNNLDHIKEVLSEEQVSALFPDNAHGAHREELYKINSEALKTANREKCEDEFVIAVVLMTQGKGQLGNNIHKANEIFDEMKKTYKDTKNISKMKELDAVLSCYNKDTGQMTAEKEKYNIAVKDLIGSVPHLMRIEQEDGKTRKRLTVNKISMEDYYQKAFEKEINGRITEKRFMSIRKNYSNTVDPKGMMEALEEEMRENLLFDQEIIEKTRKDKNVKRRGFIAEGNDEMVFNDVSEIMKKSRLTNK